MLLKNKANRKEGRVTFNKTLADLSETMKKALAEDPSANASVADIEKYIKTFDDFNIQAIKLENSYNAARTAAEEMVAVIEDLLFLTENKQKVDVVAMLGLVKRRLKEIDDKYFASRYEETLKAHTVALKKVLRAESKKINIVKKLSLRASKIEASPETVTVLEALRMTAKEMLEQPQYNFFRIGYYIYTHPNTDLSKMPADEANEMAKNFLDKDFMDSFIALAKIAVQYSESASAGGIGRTEGIGFCFIGYSECK
jgi:hypothetical protein